MQGACLSGAKVATAGRPAVRQRRTRGPSPSDARQAGGGLVWGRQPRSHTLIGLEEGEAAEGGLPLTALDQARTIEPLRRDQRHRKRGRQFFLLFFSFDGARGSGARRDSNGARAARPPLRG